MCHCKFRRTCAFFQNQMEYMPGTAGLYRQQYCHKAPAKCARHQIYTVLGPPAVPRDLFPYQQTRVEAILAKAKARLTA